MMPKLQFSIVLQANPDQLVNIATNYKNLSKYLPKQIQSVKIIQQDDNGVVTEEKIIFKTIMKSTIIQQSLHQRISDNETFMKILIGPAKGTSVRTLYEKVDNGTRVMVDVDVKLGLKFKVFYPIIKKEYKRFLMGILFKMNTDGLNKTI